MNGCLSSLDLFITTRSAIKSIAMALSATSERHIAPTSIMTTDHSLLNDQILLGVPAKKISPDSKRTTSICWP